MMGSFTVFPPTVAPNASIVTTVLSDTIRGPTFSQQLISQHVLDGEMVVLGGAVSGVPTPIIT